MNEMRILIVEDEVLSRFALADYLQNAVTRSLRR